MNFIDLSFISLALALDAFGVGFSLGLNKRMTKRLSIFAIVSFGFFQFLFSTLGGVLGNLFNIYIFKIHESVGGIVIFIIGLLMIREGFSKDEDICNINYYLISILAICVSIDALVIGFSSLSNLSIYLICKDTIFLGTIAFILTGLAFFITRNIREVSFIKKYSNFLGGIILILFSLKFLIS